MTTQADFVLARTGSLPLKLSGVKIASCSTAIVNGRERNRWHAVDVYQAAKFVAHVQWRSSWDGEQPHDTCLVDDTLDALASQLLQYDPLEYLIGYPEGSQFERKQERLEQAITDDWSAMLSDLFTTLNVSETL